MTKFVDPDRARMLIAKIQECEQECHDIGFTRAAHSVNAAKNAIGWDFAEYMSRIPQDTSEAQP